MVATNSFVFMWLIITYQNPDGKSWHPAKHPVMQAIDYGGAWKRFPRLGGISRAPSDCTRRAVVMDGNAEFLAVHGTADWIVDSHSRSQRGNIVNVIG